MNGYIRLHRSITEWEWYGNANTFIVFVHCLLMANWKDGRFEGIEVPRGSFVTSINSLSKQTGLSIQAIRTALAHLKSTGEITVKSTHHFTVIHIENYALYQEDVENINKQATNEQQTINNNIKKKKRKKENNLTTTLEKVSEDCGKVDNEDLFNERVRRVLEDYGRKSN